jgi:hypothetical protein
MPGNKTRLWRLVENMRATQDAAKRAAKEAKEQQQQLIEVEKAIHAHQDKQPRSEFYG